MKRLILATAFFCSVATFAQKDELKTLKKIYGKETISQKDLEAYKAALNSLEPLAKEEGDKVYTKFYKVMYPTLELYSKGDKATLQDQIKLYNPQFITEYGNVIDETMAYEAKVGKKIYTDDLVQEKQSFKNQLSMIANSAYTGKKYKEASSFFYALYLFDEKNEGNSLENAAITAVQGEDYKAAEKLYEELVNSDYMKNGVIYYAVNKASGQEEQLPNRETRTKSIATGVYEKPRDVKVSTKLPDTYKMLASLADHNKNMEKAKKYYEKAVELNPADMDIKKAEARIYFNEAYELLKDDQKLVDEINSFRDDKPKYDELMAKRKEIFKKTIPLFEKAYSLDSSDINTKNLLKMAYQVTGQNEKANKIN